MALATLLSKSNTYLHRALIMKIICRKKKKQLAVLDTCNDHENYTQHWYRFFFSLSYKPSLYPQRVVLLEPLARCVALWFPVQIQDRRHATVTAHI